MSVTRCNRSERAVSPVLGVVLLVAITVLLSATIAGVVLGIGAEPDLPPQVEWSFSYNATEDVVHVRHDGGDPVDPARVRVVGGALEEDHTLADFVDQTWRVGTTADIAVQPTTDARDIALILQRDDGSGHILAEFELPTE